MTKTFSLRLLPLLLIAAASAACAAQSGGESGSGDGASSDEAEVQAAKATCSSTAYDKAFAQYKAAVDGAKARARGEVCDDNTPLYEISGHLRAATSTCAKFEAIIATSQWAQPVRDALKGNLTLAMVTGKLNPTDMKGLGEALPGATIFGPAPGVYGNMSKLSFEANGKAKLSRLSVSDSGEATWSDSPATWSIPAPKKLKIEAEGRSITYDITNEEGDLHFVPAGGGADDFRSMPSECEA